MTIGVRDLQRLVMNGRLDELGGKGWQVQEKPWFLSQFYRSEYSYVFYLALALFAKDLGNSIFSVVIA